jgi:hypothetical protein
MKKKFLAVNVALALGAMSGLAGAATISATDTAYTAFGASTTTTGNVAVAQGNVVVADNHIGSINVVPYYSVQNGNTVALTITNNDQLNGKAVKVRFRGAAWSDDVLDFQVFLSPSDVWTASIVKNAAGNAVLSTHGAAGDQTATLPNFNNGDAEFAADVRLATSDVGGTLEGYVEIITMADIPPKIYALTNTAGTNGIDDTDGTFVSNNSGSGSVAVVDNPLFKITKHTATGGAPLARTDAAAAKALNDLAEDSYWTSAGSAAAGAVVDLTNGVHRYAADVTAAAQTGGSTYGTGPEASQFGADKNSLVDDWLQFPTSGISTFVTVINVDSLKAYTLQATALKNATTLVAHANPPVISRATSGVADDQGIGAIKAYFQQRGQSGDTVAWSGKGERATADKIFGLDTGVGRSGGGFAKVQLLQWDLPDLSTPTTATVATIRAAGATAAGSLLTDAAVSNDYYPGGPAAAQRDLVSYALQAPGFAFDYVTEPLVNGSTDVVLNQPLRRFFYWYEDVTALVASNPLTKWHREFVVPAGKFRIYGEANTPYEVLDGEFNSITTTGTFFTGREEEFTPGASGEVGFSPRPPSAPTGLPILRGEVAVLSVHTDSGASRALDAVLTVNHLNGGNVKNNGWGWISTTVAGDTKVPAVFQPDINTASSAETWGLRGHPLLKGGSVAAEPTLDTGGAGAVAHNHTSPNHSVELPFIGYTTVNVFSPAIGQAYGTTLPVRKGPRINP